MRRKEVVGAIGGDCLPNGTWVAGSLTQIQRGSFEADGPILPWPGHATLFPRIWGDLRIIGQAQREPSDPQRGAWLYDGGQWQHLSTEAPGVSPCIFDLSGNVHIATAAQGSQGFRYCDLNGTLVTGDDTLNAQRAKGVELGLSDFWEFTHLAGVTIGQGQAACIAQVGHGPHRVLEPGACYDIRFQREGDDCSVAMIKREENKAVFLWFKAQELDGLPLETGPIEPPIDPPVDPETPVQLPDNVYATLKALRPKYPTPLGDQGAALLNEVAWTHRAEGYGLESKSGGNTCPQPTTGKTCGCDILRTQTLGWDCLGDAEGAGTPVQADSGPADPARFVAPIDPGNVEPPVDPPVDPPTGDLEARVAALEKGQKKLEARVTKLEQGTPTIPQTSPATLDVTVTTLGATYGGSLTKR